jgi:predicted LPLAT superfamily acyltransferase
MNASVQRRGWLDVAELGSVWGIRFVVRLCRLFGRGAARAFLRVLVFYYLLFNASARRASRTYFRRLGQGEVGFGAVFRHFCTFADVALDRLLIAGGERSLFEVTSNGREHLDRLTREKRGALLIGAHLGSFEAMRLGAVTQQLPINMVVNFSNAKHIQSVLEQLDPQANARFISVAGGAVDFMLKIRECIERGEMVAILADRVGVDARTVQVDFLGAKANFAAGPFIMAAALHCPVYLTFGIYRGGTRYDLYCEPFAERVDLPRKQREQALQATVQRFADKLEEYVRKAPYNWFNFYDFWSSR